MALPGVRAINGVAATIASTVLVTLSCASGLAGPTPLAAIPLTIASAAYLVGLLVGPMVVERYAWGRGAYFAVQLGSTVMLLWCSNAAMVLAPLAVISQAVLYLRPRVAALVIAAIVAMTITALLTLAGDYDLRTCVGGILSYATAVAFVVAFSWIAMRQHDQRERATQLAAELEIARDRAADLASTRERNRIARDVHDGLGHSLTVAHIQLEAALDVIRRDPERAEQIITRVRSVVQNGLRDVRSSVGLLRDESRPAALATAIEMWAAQLRAEGFAVSVELPDETPLSPALAHVLYRATQEAMTNVRKHAMARSVEIAMSRDELHWRLRVSDDGRGAASTAAQGFGLEGIRERAASLGGQLAIATEPGRGFALTLELPRQVP